MTSEKTGVVLMTYGSATVAENVSAYMHSIYKGKASTDTITEFERRYRLVGHSPLIEITGEQAMVLAEKLGGNYVVKSGMRHSEPTIESAIKECKDNGATKLIGIILSPQFSSFIMEGYRTAFTEAGTAHGFTEIRVAEPWPEEKHFIELLSSRVRSSLETLQRLHGRPIPIIFTTHSLPQRVVEKDPTYLSQLEATRAAILATLSDLKLEWYASYQSAGHTPEAWLKPDLADILKKLSGSTPAVLVVPIQFLADHLEILYDLDIAAAEQCADAGIAYNRINLPNTDALFIEALAAIAHRK